MLRDHVRCQLNVVRRFTDAPADHRPPLPKPSVISRPINPAESLQLGGPAVRKPLYECAACNRERLQGDAVRMDVVSTQLR